MGVLASLAVGYAAYILSREDDAEIIAPRANDRIGKVKLTEERPGLFVIDSR